MLSVLSLLSVQLDDALHHGRVLQGGDVAQLLRPVGGDLPQDPAHYLAGARLGQAGHDLPVSGRCQG